MHLPMRVFRRLVVLLLSAGLVFTVSAAVTPASASIIAIHGWPHKAGTYPVVYIENDTGTTVWQISTAVSEWGRNQRFGRCVAGYPCVKVTQYYGGINGTLARAPLGISNGYLVDARIELNASYLGQPGMDTAKRERIVKHEEGHAGFGLGHDPYYGVMGTGETNYVSAYEVSELHTIYDGP